MKRFLLGVLLLLALTSCGLSWQEDGTLLLNCETAEGGSGTLRFDPDTERPTTVELRGLPPAVDGQ